MQMAKILVVKDNVAPAGALVAVLRNWDHQAKRCHIREVQTIIDQEKFDLLFIHDDKGLKLLQEIRRQGVTVPAVLVVEEICPEVDDSNLEPVTVIRKPLTTPSAARAIEIALGSAAPT